MRRLSRRSFLGGLVGAAGSAVLLGTAWNRSQSRPPATASPVRAAGTEPPATTAAPASTTTAPPAESTVPPAESTVPPSSTTSTTTTTTTVPQRTVTVICPAGWGALPVAGDFRQHEFQRMTVHHTASFLESNDLAPSRVRMHQRFHQDRGWPDLAYHFIVDAEGNVYEGRPLNAVGDTGTAYDPTGHFLVSCEGNFDRQTVPAAQRARLVDLLTWAAATFGIEPATIAGHRDVAATSCPGDELYASIADGSLVADVASVLATEQIDLTTVCGDEATALVARIESGSA